MIARIVAVCGALLFAQFPQFYLQYHHELIGHIKELNYQVSLMEKQALLSGKSLMEWVAKFVASGDADFSHQGELMKGMIDRLASFQEALHAMSTNPFYLKPFLFVRYFDQAIALDTLNSFQFGLNFNAETIFYALFGLLFGWGFIKIFTSFTKKVSFMNKICLFLLCMAPLFAGEKEGDSILHVNGSGKVWIKTTLAEVRLGIEVEGKKSTDVQNQLSTVLNQILTHLKNQTPLRIGISNFTVYPEYNDQTPRQIKGYRGDGEITLTTEIEKTAEFIALAMDRGATKVNGIQLEASQEARNEASQLAIKQACSNAIDSAKTAFEALSLEFDEIVNVDLTKEEPVFHPFKAAAAFNASTGPQVEGEEVVQSNIRLQIHFKPK